MRPTITTSYSPRKELWNIMTEALDFLMTEDDKYLITEDSIYTKYNKRQKPNTIYN